MNREAMYCNRIGWIGRLRIALSLLHAEDYHEFSWKNEEIQSILPLRKNDIRGVSITIHGKVPSWLRVDNDMGVAQPTLLAYSPGIIAVPDQQKSLPNGTTPKSHSFDFEVPSTSSPSVSTTSSSLAPPLVARSPTSSPVLRRTTKKPRSNLFAFHTMKRRSSNMVAPETEAFAIPSSSLIGSLSLEHPALFDSRIKKTPHTLPSTSEKRTSTQRREPKPTANFFDDYDFDRFSDKRASIRSEPGDEFSTPPARHRFSLKPRVVASNSVPIPKSESVTATLASLGDERSMFEPLTGKNTSSLPRTINRRSTPITKGNISLPTGPLRRAVPHPPQRKQVYGQFVLEYSGGEGGAEGYYREVTTKVTVNVKPSLIFGQFEVKVVEG